MRHASVEYDETERCLCLLTKRISSHIGHCTSASVRLVEKQLCRLQPVYIMPVDVKTATVKEKSVTTDSLTISSAVVQEPHSPPTQPVTSPLQHHVLLLYRRLQHNCNGQRGNCSNIDFMIVNPFTVHCTFIFHSTL